jgi:AraC family transcriptional regulator
MKPETHQSYKPRILRALVYLQAHLDEEVPLNDLAAVACFSPYHFHRIFRGMVGEPVAEHVRRLRMERAAHRLRFTSKSITNIALEAGYDTHESFTCAFHAEFGRSPSTFRADHHAAIHAAARCGIHYSDSGSPNDFAQPRFDGKRLKVRKQHLPLMRVAFLRHVGPFHTVGSTWSRLMAWAGRAGLFSSMAGTLGVCHDDPDITAPENLRYDAAIIIRHAEIRPEGDIGFQEIGPGEYAVAAHMGPYEKLGETYARMCGEWLPESGFELSAGPALEFYRNSPMDTSPENLLTEIYLPLAV